MKRQLAVQRESNIMTPEERQLQKKFGGHFCNWPVNKEMNANVEGFGNKCKNYGKKDPPCKPLLTLQSCNLQFCWRCYEDYCREKGNWIYIRSFCLNTVCDRLGMLPEDRALILNTNIEKRVPGFDFSGLVQYGHIANQTRKAEREVVDPESIDEESSEEEKEEYVNKYEDDSGSEEEKPPNPNTPQQEKMDDNTEITIYKIIRGTIDKVY